MSISSQSGQRGKPCQSGQRPLSLIEAQKLCPAEDTPEGYVQEVKSKRKPVSA
jgi:hypothetical protein